MISMELVSYSVRGDHIDMKGLGEDGKAVIFFTLRAGDIKEYGYNTRGLLIDTEPFGQLNVEIKGGGDRAAFKHALDELAPGKQEEGS